MQNTGICFSAQLKTRPPTPFFAKIESGFKLSSFCKTHFKSRGCLKRFFSKHFLKTICIICGLGAAKNALFVLFLACLVHAAMSNTCGQQIRSRALTNIHMTQASALVSNMLLQHIVLGQTNSPNVGQASQCHNSIISRQTLRMLHPLLGQK